MKTTSRLRVHVLCASLLSAAFLLPTTALAQKEADDEPVTERARPRRTQETAPAPKARPTPTPTLEPDDERDEGQTDEDIVEETPPEPTRPRPTPAGPAQPYYLGYESEPAMDAGGRDVTTVTRVIEDLLDKIVPRKLTWLRVAWELPLPIVLQLVPHEGFGHGARARELGLHARYGLGPALSAWTDVEETPQSNDDVALICAGGSEASAVLARRLLLDMYQGRGGTASLVPFLLMGKYDLPLYIAITPKPDQGVRSSGDEDNPSPDSFVDQYTSGNDMAFWLVARQAQRRGDGPQALWDQEYVIDLADPELRRNWEDLRQTAIWTAVDPAVLATLFSYGRDHLLHGERDIHPPRIPLGGGIGATVATRGALGPSYVSRFLDLLITHRLGVLTVYARDLDSSTQKTWGFGLGLQRVELTPKILAGVQADFWREPRSLEGAVARDCWSAALEGDAMVTRRLGVSLTMGAKSTGYFPGRPLGKGLYLGAGALFRF